MHAASACDYRPPAHNPTHSPPGHACSPPKVVKIPVDVSLVLKSYPPPVWTDGKVCRGQGAGRGG